MVTHIRWQRKERNDDGVLQREVAERGAQVQNDLAALAAWAAK